MMKMEFSKDWCVRMAQCEADSEIGVGPSAQDPVFAQKTAPLDESNIAFGRFVRLMRRHRGLTLEKLADDADVGIVELVEIEDDARHKPEQRTVSRLADYFHVPHGKLMQVAGLTEPKDARLIDQAIRFAARTDPVARLTPQEQAALESFVAILSE